MNDLYVKTTLDYTTSLEPRHINKNIDNVLLNQIKNEVEGKCIKEGYVKLNSVKIVSRSLGEVLLSHFNGNVIYHVKYSAEICNPLEGAVIKARVVNKNKMGILANGDIDDPESLKILLAKQHHMDNENFDNKNVNDSVLVKILGKRFEFGQNFITIIGVLIEESEIKEDLGTIYFSNNSKEYSYLSPYEKGMPFIYDNRNFKTIQHAFESQKSKDKDFKDLFTLGTDKYIGDSGSKAKQFGSDKKMKELKYEKDESFEENKTEILKDVISKFYEKNNDLLTKLKDTGNVSLVYKGIRVDTFMGMNMKKNGENVFGKLLMELRDS